MPDLIKLYGKQIKKQLDAGNAARARSMVIAGLMAEKTRVRFHSDRRMPKAYRMLNQMGVEATLEGLRHPENYVWTNIFAPVEILQCFGMNCVSMECISSFLAGFEIEDYCIDFAENHGIAPTLCSYHKNFLGSVLSGLVPTPEFAVTTSMICDGNINTFHYLSKRYGIDHYILDIPDEYSEAAEEYVVGQLEEMIVQLEQRFGHPLDWEELKCSIRRENESKANLRAFMEQCVEHDYPTTMTLQLYLMFATHLQIGSEQVRKFFALLKEDIKSYPSFPEGSKRLLWVHLLPYYQETLKSYLNFGEKYKVQCMDLNLDYMEPLDEERPLHALARKMLLNVYNGGFERKTRMLSQMVDELELDAVIHFCHWGCKQSVGGVMLLKQEMQEKGVPMLVLDGDAVDRRNSHDGQIKTRLEAFLELIDGTGAEA